MGSTWRRTGERWKRERVHTASTTRYSFEYEVAKQQKQKQLKEEVRWKAEGGGGGDGASNLAHNNGAVYCKFKIRQCLPDSTYNPLHAVDFLP